MKTFKNLLTLACFFALCYNLTAQNIQDRMRFSLDLANQEYKDVVRFNMGFTEEETAEFWPIINKYIAEKDKLISDDVDLFALDFTQLDGFEAEIYVKRVLAHETKLQKIKNRHFKKIRKLLPPSKFLRFLQIDDFIETARDFMVSSQLPLARG